MKLLHNKKLLAIISSVTVLIVIISVVCVVTLNNKVPTLDTDLNPSVSETAKEVVIETPDNTVTSDTATAASQIIDDGSALKPEENVSNSTTSKTTGEKAQNTVTQVQKVDPPKDAEKNNASGGIQIGSGGTTTTYSCGCANHHCNSPEAHAFVLNLEAEGCPYCGSHSCPSFYGVDQWGNAGYFPKLCPKYDITKDPVYYCQVCGKKCGDGKNGTCVQFVNDCYCPNCGQFVKANTCHTCK